MNYQCEKCRKTLDEVNFYSDRTGKKLELCKKCLTMHVDNNDPETFMWILEKADVPYVPEEWARIREKEERDKGIEKMTGMSVLGKYLAKMRLKQWKDYTWADTEKIANSYKEYEVKQLEQQNKIEAQLKGQLENGEISQTQFDAQYDTLITPKGLYDNVILDGGHAPLPPMPPMEVPDAIDLVGGLSDVEQLDLPNPADELTKDDKVYLAMKWGLDYTPLEWIDLEKKYTEMKQSFEINDSDTEGSLILICKTYVKMNQAINQNDMETYAKLSRIYEALRKSAKFTAAQNKSELKDFVTSIGEIVVICEKDGFIPRYVTDVPQDKVDTTLKDNNNYIYKLVTQDLGFGQQIEDALKKIQMQKEVMQEEEKLDMNTFDVTLDNEDYQAYFDDIERQKQEDALVTFTEEKGVDD